MGMLHDIAILKQRVLSVGESYDVSIASDILQKFEEFVSSRLDIMLQEYEKEIEVSWDITFGKNTWFEKIFKMDQALGNDNPPDRPWTRAFWQYTFNKYKYSASLYKNDFQMIGSRYRSEDVMDRLLEAYFKPLSEIGDYRDYLGNDLAKVEIEPNKFMWTQEIYIKRTKYWDEDGHIDWGTCDIIDEGLKESILSIIEECLSLSERQNAEICRWRLAECLVNIEAA